MDISEDGGVLKEILIEGTGNYLNKGDEVEIHYKGNLENGIVFDSSIVRKTSFKFILGEGKVIKGWDIGVATMRIGEKAILTCRHDYAYGSKGKRKKIPKNATLIFEIEILSRKERTPELPYHQIPSEPNPSNPKCFLDIIIGDSEIKRIIFELFADIVPKTAENFRVMCTGENETRETHLSYQASIFHRVIKGFMMQGGDIIKQNGTGNISIYGDKFDDENFRIKHSQAGLLSMANSGENTNGCQFFITYEAFPHLDSRHVVFGRVIEGMSVCIEVGNVETGTKDVPIREVRVVQCGQLY